MEVLKGVNLLMEKIKVHLTATLVCLSFALPGFAHSSYKGESSKPIVEATTPAWLSMGAYGGYGNVNGGYKNDGQVTQGRLTLGAHAADYKFLSFGVEAGVQSGNDMRLSARSSVISTAGGLPIQSTLKPLVDLLITVKGQLSTDYPLVGILKGGIAYRQLQLNDRSSSQDGLRKVNGELQVGLGYNVTRHAMLTVFYQGIYAGGNAGVSINSVGDVTLTRIPTQQAGFLGLEYSI